MPYIHKEDRVDIEAGRPPVTSGELNYSLTYLALRYLEVHGEKYQTYNDILGALEGCKLELYRRRVVPLEDLKKIENGDVY